MKPQREKSQEQRRKRKFTTPETLAMHPIVRLYSHPAVIEVLSLRREKALRFSDLQFLLCREEPATVPKNCPEAQNCEECPMFKKCLRDLPGVWRRAFSRAELEDMRIFRSKPQLYNDLSRLVDAGYISRVKRGRYQPSKDVESHYSAAALKKYLGRVVNECPPDFVHIDEHAYFLFLEKDLVEKHREDFKELCMLTERTRRKLGELMMKSILSDVSKAFKKELSGLSDDREKVHLHQYLKDHISIQLANLGLKEARFKDELSDIYNTRLNITKSKLRRIEREIGAKKRTVREAKRRISKAFWMEQKESPWAEKYESLMAGADEAPSKAEIERVKRILRKEEDFQNRFHNSDMCIRPNALENSPFIVMEYSPFILPVCESEAEGEGSEAVRRTTL